ncbi:hypothetical protein FACS18945_6000 [Bacteroidia bacterium]|nr:hypothetical protein FACS18945_6000 [Bacteroidia bacterium]
MKNIYTIFLWIAINLCYIIRYKIYKMEKEMEYLETNFKLTETHNYGRPFVFPADKFLSKEEYDGMFNSTI